MLPGVYVRRAAEHLVLDVLASYPGGLSNKRIGELTGLNPPLTRQRDYITWSILQDLVGRQIVVRDGRYYRRIAEWREG